MTEPIWGQRREFQAPISGTLLRPARGCAFRRFHRLRPRSYDRTVPHRRGASVTVQGSSACGMATPILAAGERIAAVQTDLDHFDGSPQPPCDHHPPLGRFPAAAVNSPAQSAKRIDTPQGIVRTTVAKGAKPHRRRRDRISSLMFLKRSRSIISSTGKPIEAPGASSSSASSKGGTVHQAGEQIGRRQPAQIGNLLPASDRHRGQPGGVGDDLQVGVARRRGGSAK